MDNEGTQTQSGTEQVEPESWLSTLPVEAQTEIKKLREENAKTRKKVGLEDKENEIAELKAKLKDKENKALEEKQQFRELYELTKKEKSELENSHKSIQSEYEIMKAEREAEREALLAKLPDDMKSEFANSTKKQLQILLAQLTKSENSIGAKTAGNELIDLDAMSLEEQLKMNRENPEQYTKLKTQQFEKRRKGN